MGNVKKCTTVRVVQSRGLEFEQTPLGIQYSIQSMLQKLLHLLLNVKRYHHRHHHRHQSTIARNLTRVSRQVATDWQSNLKFKTRAACFQFLQEAILGSVQ